MSIKRHQINLKWTSHEAEIERKKKKALKSVGITLKLRSKLKQFLNYTAKRVIPKEERMKFEGIRRLNLGCVVIHLPRRGKCYKHWENVKFFVDLI